MAIRTKRKLDAEQIEAVAQVLRQGMTWKQATQWVKDFLAIEIDRTNLAQYPELKQAVKDRKAFRLVEVGEVVEGTIKPAIETIQECLIDLRAERRIVSERLKKTKPGTPEYRDDANRMKSIDAAIAAYHKPLQDALKATQDHQSGIINDQTKDSAEGFFEYLAELNKTIRQKPEEQKKTNKRDN